MPINSKHEQWENTVYSWQKNKDAMGGEKEIKRKNTKYLDMPAGMAKAGKAVSIGGTATELLTQEDGYGDDVTYDPTWHPNPAYRSYLRRAYFPDIAAFTVRGLVGIATKKESKVVLPKSLDYLVDNFTKDGKSLAEFYKYAIRTVLATGRLPCVVDIAGGALTVVTYSAEQLINWGGFYNFEESYVDKDTDMFSVESKTKWKTLLIDENGDYAVGETKTDSAIMPEVITNPMYRGKKLNRMPTVILGSTNLDDDVDQIPIDGIVDCAIQIYKKDADLSHAEYVSCNPTLTISGIDKDDAPSVIGSSVVLILEPDNAKAYYPNTDTSALTHVQSHIDRHFERAANFGAQLLSSPKKGTEAAETVRLQQSAGGATLAGVVDTVSAGIVDLITIIAEWSGATGDIEYEGNKEFSDMTFSAAELKELRESWMAGGTSHETYLYNLKRAGLIEKETEINDELDLIEFASDGNTGNEGA